MTADHLPPLALVLLFNGFAVLRFENYRWRDARQAARRRAGDAALSLAGLGLPDWSYIAGTAFNYAFLVWIGWAIDWGQMVVLFVSSWIVGYGYIFLSTWLLGGDHPAVHRAATVAMWPVALLMAYLFMA